MLSKKHGVPPPQLMTTSFDEQLADGLMHSVFDVDIQVVEREAHLFGELPAQCGLSGSHVSNDDDSNHLPSLFFAELTIFIHSSYVSSAAFSCRFFGIR